MATYRCIIENIIKTKNYIFFQKNENENINNENKNENLNNENKNENIDNKFKILFLTFLNQEYSVKNKFRFFYKILHNFWIKREEGEHDKFIDYFCKIQKTYNILNRFAYVYKWKKAKMVVNMDMGLNELRENDKNIICIFHNQAKYLFYINDLLNIIKNALTNSYMFFSEPLSIKNPYNNIPFNKSILYNIYFFIKYKTTFYEALFFRFFKYNFNLTEFKENSEYILREYAINHYVYKSTTNILIKEINNMIDTFNEDCKFKRLKNKITIDIDFPRDKLIKIFQPYLLLYMISNYGYTNTQKKEANYMFNYKMRQFNNYNHLFGRKKYKFILEHTSDFKRKIKGKIIEFDDKHITFNNIEKQNDDFLNDHLKITDNIDNIDNNILNNNTQDYMSISFTSFYITGANYNSIENEEKENTDDEDSDDEDTGDTVNNDNNTNDNNTNDNYDTDNEEKEEDYDY
jgi:hypothetical protein